MLLNRSIVRRLFVSSDSHACRDAVHSSSSSSSQCSPRTGRGLCHASRHTRRTRLRNVRFLNSPATAAALASQTHSFSYHPSYSDPHAHGVSSSTVPRVTVGSLAQLRDPLLYSCGTCGSQCRISYSKELPVIMCRRCHIPLSVGAHTSVSVASVSIAQPHKHSVLDKVRDAMYNNPSVPDPYHQSISSATNGNVSNMIPDEALEPWNDTRDVAVQSSDNTKVSQTQAKLSTHMENTTATETEKLNERFLQGVTIVDTPEKARKVVDMLRSPELRDYYHCCDTEAVGLDAKVESPVGHGRIISASIFVDPSVDFGNGPRLWIDNLDDASGTLEVFKEYFEDESIKKVCMLCCSKVLVYT